MKMETKLTYYRMLPLKEMSLRNVTTLLWTQPQILASLDDIRVESFVEQNMRKLILPTKIREQIKFLVKPIGIDIKNWKKFHEVYLDIGNINMLSFVHQLCWTWSVGVVDYAKTAENMIRYKMFDTVKLYKLACLYCLEEDVRVLWEKLPTERKNYFYQEKGPLYIKNSRLEYYWPYIIKGEEIRLEHRRSPNAISFNQFSFNNSVFTCNTAAAHYFFHKLPSHIRKDVLSKMVGDASIHLFIPFEYCRRVFSRKNDFPGEKASDIFIYLLSLMQPEQQMEIFKDQSCKNLKYFLEWPWQDLFLDMADLTWKFLNPYNYVYLLNVIATKIKCGYQFSKIFQEFFLRGSSDFITEFVRIQSRRPIVLCALLQVDDSETITVIFRKLDSKNRRRLIFSKSVFNIFVTLFLSRQSHSVQLCIQEATLSSEEKEKLKEHFFAHLSKSIRVNESSNEFIRKQILIFLDENVVKVPSKRKFDE